MSGLSPVNRAAARLESQTTQLVPLAPEHLPALRQLELSEDLAFRWRHAGTHPSPEAYVASTWNDVLCSFLVFSTQDTSSPRGLVSAYQPDHVNGHCRVAATRLGSPRAQNPAVMRGVMMLFDYLFKGWPFRKLYLEVPAYNLEQFESALTAVFTEEGRLSSYTFLDGEYWDLVFLSLSRDHWRDCRARFGRFIDGANHA